MLWTSHALVELDAAIECSKEDGSLKDMVGGVSLQQFSSNPRLRSFILSNVPKQALMCLKELVEAVQCSLKSNEIRRQFDVGPCAYTPKIPHNPVLPLLAAVAIHMLPEDLTTAAQGRL